MNEKRIKTVALENGLELSIYDASHPMIGDRWLIKLIARVDIPVEQIEIFAAEQNLDHTVLMRLLGEPVAFTQERTRKFIDAGEREAVLQEMIDSFDSSFRDYTSHPEFARKFLHKAYLKARQRSAWYTGT